MADENTEAPAEETTQDAEKTVNQDPKFTAPQDKAGADQLGNGKPKKADTDADPQQSANVVGRSSAALAVTAVEQDPTQSALLDKAPQSQNPNKDESKDTEDLVYRSGPVNTGRFWTASVNGHTYVFEEGIPLSVDSGDVDDLLKDADESEYYSITKA